MALLDALLAQSAPASWGDVDTPMPSDNDPFAVAAERLRRGVKRPKPEWGADATALPFGGANPLGAGMLSGIMPQPSSDLPPSTNDPMSSEPVVFEGGVPLPRPRPVTPNTPASSGPSDVSSAGAAPGAPMSISPPGESMTGQMGGAGAGPAADASGGGMSGIFGRLFRPENAPLLLSLAGGFAGAPSIGTGMRRAFSGAAPAAMQMQQSQQKVASLNATYQSLLARGVPQHEAMAAALNPDLMKAVAAKYFETKPRVPHKISVDMMGNDIMGSFDPNSGKYFNASNKEIGGGADGGAGMPDAGAGMLAKGVTELNQELPADEFKAQFSPQVQAQIDAYVRGDTMPTGNPRLKGSATKVKEWATLYGAKAGIPVSDATFSERRKYRTELGSNSAAAAGGQAKAFNQAVEHADGLATQLEKLGNVDPVGIPIVSKGLNATREALSTKQAGIATEARRIGQTLAGEVGKLFSGSQGGGVHERELTRNAFNTVNSPRELAGALEGTLETMEGGLRALEQRRDQILGPGSNVEFVNKETHEKIARIRKVIERLKSGEAAPAAPVGGKTGSGIQWSIVQ